MLNSIQTTLVMLLDGALLIIKKVRLNVVRLVWIRLSMPNQGKRNVTFGYIAHPKQGVTLQISMNTRTRSAGLNT